MKKRAKKKGLYIAAIERGSRKTLGHITVLAATWSQVCVVVATLDGKEYYRGLSKRTRRKGLHLSARFREVRKAAGSMTIRYASWSQVYEVVSKLDRREQSKLLRQKLPAIRCQPTMLKSTKRHS